MASENEMSH